MWPDDSHDNPTKNFGDITKDHVEELMHRLHESERYFESTLQSNLIEVLHEFEETELFFCSMTKRI